MYFCRLKIVWLSWTIWKYAAVCCRLNGAPVKGFEKDVGSKTTLRITYPEGAIQKTENYEDQSLFVLSAFKAQDFKWLRHMIYKQSLVRLLESIDFATVQLIVMMILMIIMPCGAVISTVSSQQKVSG